MLRLMIIYLSLTAALFATGVFAPAEAVTLSSDRVFAYAEANYPTLFPGTATDQQFQQYTYRYYPATANYLAVDTNNVIFRLGPDTGNVITNVGSVASFADAIIAWEALSAGVTSQNGVTASGLGESITVSWTNTCKVCSWQLSTRQGTGPWIIQAVLPKGSAQYTINDLLPGQKYLVKMAEKRAARWVDRALVTATTTPIVAGPLVYELVESRLIGQGQPGLGSAAETAAVTGVIASLIPESAPVMGTISAIEGLVAGNQTAKQISELTAEVAQQQAEINNIEAILSLDQNIFYAYVQAQAQIITQIWFYGYQTSFNAIQGPDGAYSQFLANLQVPPTGQWPPTTTYATLAANSAIMAKLNTVATAGTTAYMANLQNLSTAVVPVDCTACYKNTVQTKLAGAGSENSATMQVFDALYQQLQTYVPIPGTATANNFALVLEAYNNEIMSIYQQNIAALQEAYTVEASENYLNYINGQNNGGLNQIAGIEDIPEITYTFSNLSLATEQQNLTNAQVKLALLYAARINQLYNTALQYIVSDQPNSSFTWPAPPTFKSASVNSYVAAHPYKSFIAQTKPAATIAGAIGQAMPKVTGNPYLFYQYDGLNQFYLCGYNLSPDPLTATTCPPLLPNGTGATWNGVNFSVYYNLNSPMQLVPTINVNQVSASPGTPLLLWSQQLTTGPAVALLPTSIKPGYPAPSSNQGSLNIRGFSANDSSPTWPFTYQVTYSNLAISPTNSTSWFSQSGDTQSIKPAKIKGGLSFLISNQFSATNGFVGAFYLISVGASDDPEVSGIGLTCSASDQFCSYVPNGICLGGNQLQITGSGCGNESCGIISYTGGCLN